VAVGDPVGVGLVASLARPGGNITGLSNMMPDVAGKRLEILKEIAPDATRIAILFNPENAGNVLDVKATEAAARTMGLTTHSLDGSRQFICTRRILCRRDPKGRQASRYARRAT